MLDSLSLKVVEFLGTYLVHSFVLLSCAWCLKRFGQPKKPVIAELVWRFALFGALASTSALVFIYPNLQSQQIGNSQLRAKQQVRTEEKAPFKAIHTPEYATAISQAQLRSNLATKPRSAESAVKNHKAETTFSSTEAIFVPIKFKSALIFLALAWLGFCLFSFAQYIVQIWRLNQRVNQLEDYPTHNFHNFLNKRFPTLANKLRIRRAQDWSSPIVAPNHTICIPEWVLSTLSFRQIEVMLAHEVAHIQRNDPTWTILYQLMCRLFFFQPLNFIAVRELNSLSELACDHLAGESDPDRKLLAEALFACAKIQSDHAVPDFALAMAKTRSPLVYRVQALLEESETIARMSQYHANRGLVFFAGAISMIALMHTLPSTRLNFESIKAVANFIKKETVALSSQANPKTDETARVHIKSEDSFENLKSPSNPEPLKFSQQTAKLDEPSPHIEQIATPIFPEQHNEQSPQQWNIEDARQAINEKRYVQATEILLQLSNSGDVKAQSMLAEMYWFGEGIAPNHDEAEKWFRLAAASGDSKAQSYLNIISERKQRKQEIAFFIGESQAAGFRYLSDKCPAPEYSESLFASNTSKLDAWYKCGRKHYEALKTAKELDHIIIPASLLRVMTDSEIKKAEANSKKVIELALENIQHHRVEMQAELQAWMDAHPNLVTNSYRPTPKLPETQVRPTELRAISFPFLAKPSTP